MSNHLALVLSLSLVAACGDNHAAPSLPDARSAPPDAFACDVDAYPKAIRMASVDLRDPFDLTLDGVGSRCEQLVRAVTDPDPARRPPELAELDVSGVTGTCRYDELTDRDIVRLDGPTFAGLPLFGVTQDIVLTVSAPATVDSLHGDFVPALESALNPACLGDDQVRAALPGSALTYARYALCSFQGDGAYTVESTDTIEVGEEGYLVDRDGFLRRVRAVDVYLLAERVTAEHINSDLYCCESASLAHCVGARVFIDAVTGERVQQEQHCHSC